MLLKSGLLILGAVLLAAGSEATAMQGDTILGTVEDSRVTRCGVVIAGGELASVEPFIEAAPDLSGQFQFQVTKSSRSGTSMSSQGSGFSGGTLGRTQTRFDRPSLLHIRLTVRDLNGLPLCNLDHEVELAAGARPI